MNLVTGSSAWYVAGGRFVDGDSIVSVQLVSVIDSWCMSDGSTFYVIDFGGTRYTNPDRLFANREEADAEALRLQRLKIKKVGELLEVHIRWLERLENP